MTPDEMWRADATRAFLLAQKLVPDAFRAAVLSVSPWERDAWVDRVLGLDTIEEDGPELPRGCTPYLPCPVDAVLAAVDQAGISSTDLFVDVGFGVGRASLLVRLLTGAAVTGIEVQTALVKRARSIAQELKLKRCAVVCGDASELARYVVLGSVFFFYCPFSGDRLDQVVDELRDLAKLRPLRLCGVNTDFPKRSWLATARGPRSDLVVSRYLG